jgi:2-polyprenyl-3-methyl-5-hydroxy-6-metoxy-1,4-benzoquinol methylase
MLTDKCINNIYQGGLKRWTTIKKYTTDRKDLFNFYLTKIERFKKPKSRLLDFGCGIGVFMKTARQQGWKVRGLDISKKDLQIARANQLEVSNRKARVIDKYRNMFDMCSMFDTLEHLKYPVNALTDIYKMLKTGGRIFIDTGNVGGLVTFFGKKTPFLHNEGHIFFYSKKSLIYLLEKVGFVIEEISDERDFTKYLKKKYNTKEEVSFFDKIIRRFHSNPNIYIIARKE